eukprot:91793-Pleurochrysis_carterae.AAC.1
MACSSQGDGVLQSRRWRALGANSIVQVTARARDGALQCYTRYEVRSELKTSQNESGRAHPPGSGADGGVQRGPPLSKIVSPITIQTVKWLGRGRMNASSSAAARNHFAQPGGNHGLHPTPTPAFEEQCVLSQLVNVLNRIARNAILERMLRRQREGSRHRHVIVMRADRRQ